MNYNEVLKAAWKSLFSNKLRSLLTMLGIIIGVAAVIIMIAISAGTEATISDAIEGLGSNLAFISTSFSRGGPSFGRSGSQGGLKFDDATAISEKIKGVAGVSVEQESSQAVKYDGTTLTGVTVVGTTIDYPTVRAVSVGSGRYFTQKEVDNTQKVVVLGSGIADELFGNEDPIGQYLTVGNTKLTVIGVLAPKGLAAGTDYDQQIYTPISVVFKKFTPSQFARIMGDSVRMIIVSVDQNANMDTVVNQIKVLLVNRHSVTLDTADFSITTQDDIITTQESTTSTFRTLLAWVAGVSLIVGGIGIMNIMLVSVTERTREIGLRQAIGATPGDIQIQFLSEALILSLMGGLIGALVGIGGSHMFGSLSGMRTLIAPYSIIMSFTSAALIGVFFGYIPAQKAAQLDPIEALRHE